MSTKTNTLYDWANELFDAMFFQPDDQLAMKTFEDRIKQDFDLRVNGKSTPYDVYKGLIIDVRKKNTLTEQSNKELLRKDDDDEGKAGTVAFMTHFTVKENETGSETKSAAVILLTIAWEDGKRVLTQMTECFA